MLRAALDCAVTTRVMAKQSTAAPNISDVQRSGVQTLVYAKTVAV